MKSFKIAPSNHPSTNHQWLKLCLTTFANFLYYTIELPIILDKDVFKQFIPSSVTMCPKLLLFPFSTSFFLRVAPKASSPCSLSLSSSLSFPLLLLPSHYLSLVRIYNFSQITYQIRTTIKRIIK